MQLVPRVKALRIEEFWEVPGQRMRCVAHLTRALSSREAKIVEASARFRAKGGTDTIAYLCRPDEYEAYATRLEIALGQAIRAGAEPSSSRRRAPTPNFP